MGWCKTDRGEGCYIIHLESRVSSHNHDNNHKQYKFIQPSYAVHPRYSFHSFLLVESRLISSALLPPMCRVCELHYSRFPLRFCFFDWAFFRSACRSFFVPYRNFFFFVSGCDFSRFPEKVFFNVLGSASGPCFGGSGFVGVTESSAASRPG